MGRITERFVRRSARHLVVAPGVLQRTGIDPNEVTDRLSDAYLIAVNARTVSEVGAIVNAKANGTRLPTLTVDTVIGFASADAFRLPLINPLVENAVRRTHATGSTQRRYTTTRRR